MLEKPGKSISGSPRALRVPIAWKNTNIILIHKTGDVKELKSYIPASPLPVVYKLFSNVTVHCISDSLDFQ